MRDIDPERIPRAVWRLLLQIDAEVKLPNECALAGGYARDRAHGATPRDIDVLLTGPDWNTPDEIQAFVDRLQTRQVGRVVSVHHEYTHDMADDRLICVVKLDLSEQPGGRGLPTVDLLFYDAPTLAEAVTQFDYNLNQYIAYFDGLFGRHFEFVGENEGVLTKTDRVEELRPERVQKMHDKALALGWDTGGVRVERLADTDSTTG